MMRMSCGMTVVCTIPHNRGVKNQILRIFISQVGGGVSPLLPPSLPLKGFCSLSIWLFHFLHFIMPHSNPELFAISVSIRNNTLDEVRVRCRKLRRMQTYTYFVVKIGSAPNAPAV